MEKLCLMITSAGGNMIPEFIAELRDIRNADTRIVAVDAQTDAIGRRSADTFHTVPAGTDPDYCDAVLNICRSEGVDIVIPLSDEEALALSKCRPAIEAAGCIVLGSNDETTKLAGDKNACLTHLKNSDIPVPRFHAVSSLEEFDAALDDLGFPENEVVCKPSDGRGGRGFRILRDEVEELSEMLFTRREINTTGDRFRAALEQAGDIPCFLAMEFLTGAQFSADILVDDGAVSVAVVQKKRITSDLKVSATEIVSDARVDRAIRDIVSCFEFEHLINIDLAERTPGGEVLPLEINVRPSALLTGATVTGVSLLREAVLRAVGGEHSTSVPDIAGQKQFVGACFV